MIPSYTVNRMLAIQRNYFRKYVSLAPLMKRQYLENHEQRRKLKSVARKSKLNFHSSCLLPNCNLINKVHNSYQNCNKELIAKGKQSHFIVLRYSTFLHMQLSLSNPKVESYLAHLKSIYSNSREKSDRQSLENSRNLEPLMDFVQKMESVKSDIEDLTSLAKDPSDKEMQQLAENDLQEAKAKLQSLEEEVLNAMIPEEPLEDTDVTMEVSAGVGGQEAMLFSQEIFNMYQAYADYMGWHHQVSIYEGTEIGGLRHGSLDISGKGVYKRLKFEGGIHRVQRVPKTDSSGRIHTSTVSVAVMPQPTDIDIHIEAKDLKIEVMRASGAGGQHVNTTDSAVRITHLPSGKAFESQKGRSQHKNKEDCMKKLRAYFYQLELDEKTSQYSSSRKLQVGTKRRSEKIRTYNYQQDRVTDHRIGLSCHNLPSLLQGTDGLHDLISSVIEEAEKESLVEAINIFHEKSR